MFDGIMSAPVRPRARHGEPRWPASLATLLAVGLYGALPSELLVGPRYVIPVLELLLLVALVAANPVRMTRRTRILRGADPGAKLLMGAESTMALITSVVVIAKGVGSLR
jgi:hypothetical protein